MTDADAPPASRQIIKPLAEVYQRSGYRQIAVPARTLLSLVDRVELEHALAELLDVGEVIPVGTNGIALHPGARIALLSRQVLENWIEKVSRESGHTLGLYRDAIAKELRELTTWASAATLPTELARRAAELAGVVATADMDPRAMDVVARHGGTAQGQLAALTSVAPASCTSLDQLLLLLRNTVSTIFPAQ